MVRARLPARRTARTGALGALAALALLAAGGPTAAGDTAPVEVKAAWARATPPGAKIGAAYLTLVNEGEAPERLVAASAPVAATVELHTMAMVDDVMRMRPLPGGVALPPGETVTLKPGGMHLMLKDLEAPLTEGERFALELSFEHGPPQTVEVRVGGIGASAPPQ